MSFGMFTCCFSRAYTAIEKPNNALLYAVHVQPLGRGVLCGGKALCPPGEVALGRLAEVDPRLAREGALWPWARQLVLQPSFVEGGVLSDNPHAFERAKQGT